MLPPKPENTLWILEGENLRKQKQRELAMVSHCIAEGSPCYVVPWLSIHENSNIEDYIYGVVWDACACVSIPCDLYAHTGVYFCWSNI